MWSLDEGAQITAIIRKLVQCESRLKKLMVDGLDAAVAEELDADLVGPRRRLGNSLRWETRKMMMMVVKIRLIRI